MIPFGVMENETEPEKSPPTKPHSGSVASSMPRHAGLSLPMASVFIVGEMAGSGVLALPKAVSDAGWSGVAMVIICAIITCYSGICLGRSWIILEERYEEYKEKNRYPYSAIAYRAVGIKMRYVVSFCNDFTLLGVATVFLLLSSELIESLAHKWGINFCYWVLILALILCPLMWLGTPDDFWPAAILALSSTAVACILLIVSIAQQSHLAPHAKHAPPDVLSFFLAFGTILFAYGGASTFPTFQNDMRDRSQFPKAATIGFTGLLLMYLPVATMGYSVFGNAIRTDVLQSLPDSAIKTTIEILISMHLFFAFLLVINTPAQEMEEFFKIPRKFGWKRIVLRSSMMLLIVFVALSIPKFGNVLNLVGGSTSTLTTTVFPCLFYMRLCSQKNEEWPERNIPIPEKVWLIFIMLSGAVAGAMATASAIISITKGDTFRPPCYVNITAASRN